MTWDASSGQRAVGRRAEDLPLAPGPHAPAALVVFAKVPEPGAVKTRLVPPLSFADAAALYTAFLTDALAGFATLGVPVRLYLPPSDATLPAGIVPPGVSTHTQRGDGLGDRMDAALTETLAAGFARAAVIGTDHPTLPLATVSEALGALATPGTVAIGPSADGGFYLLGLDRPRPALFAGMTYSHDRVFERTRARAVADGARLLILPPWYDVDDAESLARLVAEWQAGASVGPRTSDALTRLVHHLPAEALRSPAAGP